MLNLTLSEHRFCRVMPILLFVFWFHFRGVGGGDARSLIVGCECMKTTSTV